MRRSPCGTAPLTARQYAIARTLSEGGPLTLGELTWRSRCVPANVTGLVDRLDRKGLARRLADPSDRRVKRVVLTDAGHRALAETVVRARAHPGRLAIDSTRYDEFPSPRRRTV